MTNKEAAMPSYQIENSVSGLILGTYKAASVSGALDAMARDAGYADYAQLQSEVSGKLIVTENKEAGQ